MPEVPFRKFTLYDSEFATSINSGWERRILKAAEDIVNDPKRKERLKKNLCKRCFQGGRVAGQAFTRWVCGLCEKDGQHANTDVPKLCNDCSKKNDLCCQCGAHVDGKTKRKLK